MKSRELSRLRDAAARLKQSPSVTSAISLQVAERQFASWRRKNLRLVVDNA